MTKRFLLAATLSASAVFTVQAADAFELKGEPKIAFIYAATARDGGWNEAIDYGREALEAELGLDVAVAENIPEEATRLRAAIDLYVKRGYNIIVGTTYGYSEAMSEAAEAYPDVAFFNASGVHNSDNMESFYARTYEAWYLAGIAAAESSKEGKIGILAGFPVGVVNWDINGFATGAQSVKPDVETFAIYTNSWWDPVKEGQVSEALLDQGADVIATDLSAASALKAAEDRGARAIGYQIDMSAAAPEGIVTSVVFHWDKYLVPRIKSVIDGSWEPSEWGWFEGIGSGVVGLAPFGPNVSDEVKADVEKAKAAIISGDLKLFAGPLKSSTGETKVAAGEVLPDEDLWSMDFFVEGITGTMPASQ
ncbi:BMP family ABC transporter substrate-binding protein [Roseibium aggregatum]|uniref:BMP family ABC transporter substrate-binding protein n=1 Tax=Roseibium aggregatum TaxID=187304 RepID=A0A939J2K7_9HYPH|nr:BMP family ABC transporter substrate-binding protein [Roseibium aggregatum]MBN9669642.1 BMP family ABC transporter substrate-binding protein [Roseibium aggregatum]